MDTWTLDCGPGYCSECATPVFDKAPWRHWRRRLLPLLGEDRGRRYLVS